MIDPERIYTLSQAKVLLAKAINALDVKTKPTVFRLEIKIKPVNQIDWLAIQPGHIKIYGSNQDDSACIAGLGHAKTLAGKKADLNTLFKQMRTFLSPQFPYLQWYGGLAFDKSDFRFVLPRFELARDGQKMMLACNLIGRINKQQVLRELIALKTTLKPLPLSLPSVVVRRDTPTQQKWHQSVQRVLNAIKLKQCQKVVLARKTVFLFKETINPWLIFARLLRVTPDSYHFAFQFGNKVFLGASPERLFKRQSRALLTQALAGSMSRGHEARELLTSPKDRHEQGLVVDAMAKALLPLSQHINYPKVPSTITLASGHHLNTDFNVILKDGINDEDVIESLHPTPALGGSPRHVALKFIKQIESFKRGWYAGPVGYVGLDWAELVVGIRSGLVDGKTLAVYAGAGIVRGSDAASEWDEIENKISNFYKIVIR